MMSIDYRVQAKRQHILRTAARHGARNVRLFGSAARGEATAAAMSISWSTSVRITPLGFPPGSLSTLSNSWVARWT